MSARLGALAGMMCQGCQAYWPGLTGQQFDDAVEAIFHDRPTGETWPIREVGNALMAELTRRHGQPRRF